MLDFLNIEIVAKDIKGGQSYTTDVSFNTIINEDLITAGGAFQAWYDEETGYWSRNEKKLFKRMDKQIKIIAKENGAKATLMSKSTSGLSKHWRSFCKELIPTSNKPVQPLDQKILFESAEVTREDYASFKLGYNPVDMETPYYDELIHTLYSGINLHMWEWAVGATLSGDAPNVDRLIILKGKPGTGKSTALNILKMMLEAPDIDKDQTHKYWSSAALDRLGSSKTFATAMFDGKDPVVFMQEDADMSYIAKNQILNSALDHEEIEVEQKYQKAYPKKLNCMFFIGSNKDFHINDTNSGMIRRILDIYPTGNTVSFSTYNKCMEGIKYELGGIAYHCMREYQRNKDFFRRYRPTGMMRRTSPVYWFVQQRYMDLCKMDPISDDKLWAMWTADNENTKEKHSYSKRELISQIEPFYKDGYDTMSKTFSGFDAELSDPEYGMHSLGQWNTEGGIEEVHVNNNWLDVKDLVEIPSLVDTLEENCPAQYSKENGTPAVGWDDVKTKLKDLDTSKEHYVRTPLNHIVIDFDIRNPETGDKDLEANIAAANMFPPTYCECSKSGKGLHLHYIYTDDPNKLSALYAPGIEIKVFKGKSALRRKLTLCNNIEVRKISGGALPRKKEVNSTIKDKIIHDQTHLENLVNMTLAGRVEGLSGTIQMIRFIDKLFEEAYDSGFTYDLDHMFRSIDMLASNSTTGPNDDCTEAKKIVLGMKMHSKDRDTYRPDVSIDIECFDPKDPKYWTDEGIGIWDWEIFCNKSLLVWETLDSPEQHVWWNPTAEQIEFLMKNYKLIGHNTIYYDNFMAYGRGYQGLSNKGLFDLSQKIISGDRSAGPYQAKNISYADTLAFAPSGKKQSLKKWEIQLDIPHEELDWDWNEPLPDDMDSIVEHYCKQDVRATKLVFLYLKPEWEAHKMLAKMAGGIPNNTANDLTKMIVFGDNKHPQEMFEYRNLADPVTDISEDKLMFLTKWYPEMIAEEFVAWDGTKSILPCFPSYGFDPFAPKGEKSYYRGIYVSEGGHVQVKEGIYTMVALLDIAGMHPSSIGAEMLWGEEATDRYLQLKQNRIWIKHKEWDKMRQGILADFVPQMESGEVNPKLVSTALKTPINGAYGLTDTSFPNPFKDERNKDNIVAKRGALFMVDLQKYIEGELGCEVIHTKTDSVKIPNATKEVIEKIMAFGKRYGYDFEHEATYERLAIVNGSTYVARYASEQECIDMYGYCPEDNKGHDGTEWTATAIEFQRPYVFKTLFSKEPIEYKDLKEVKQSTNGKIFIEREGKPDKFIGKVGAFVPLKDGGELKIHTMKDGVLRKNFPSGSKGFLWDDYYNHGPEDMDKIDYDYYNKLVTEARDKIMDVGNVEWFLDQDGPRAVLGETDPEEMPFY